MNRYESYSGIRRFVSCEEYYRLNRAPGVIPRGRGAAMIMGSALHECIRMMHGNPSLDIPSLVEGEIENQVNVNPNVPVLWGERAPWDRQGRTETAIRKMSMYWELNSHLNVVRHEAWYWFELPIKADPPLLFRGKIDQVIATPTGGLRLRELKGGDKKTSFIDLETDCQVPLEAYGLRYGKVAIEDNLPYIGEKHENYHIHEWEPIPEKPHTFVCKVPNCGIVVEEPRRFPEEISYYELCHLDPGKTRWNAGERVPKEEPETKMTPDEDWVNQRVQEIGLYMLRIREAEKTGIYLPPVSTGFGSPCDNCFVTDHCNKKVCKVQKGSTLHERG